MSRVSCPVFVVINGEVVDSQKGRIEGVSVTDRGLAYGDGVFETIRVDKGRVTLYSYHHQRLQKGLERLSIVVSPEQLETHWQQTLSQCQQLSGICKLMVTRGSGGRGYMPSKGSVPTLISQFFPFDDHLLDEYSQYEKQGVRTHWCRERLPINPSLAGIKSLNQLSYVLAAAERQTLDCEEGLVLNMDGTVVEATARNLFVVKDATLYTPALDQCGVAGVMREVIIHIAKDLYPLEVKALSTQDVLAADEVFLCNSVTGIWPVICCETHRWPVGEVTKNLQAQLSERNR